MAVPEFEAFSFWSKVRRLVGKVPFLRDAVALYYCMVDPFTPFWAKAQIAFALAYFVSPIDAIPDMTPIIGYADDASVIVATLIRVARSLTDEHRRKANAFFDGE
jgi:uncharacterized membrane protein YkvA (DUF1232 family)